SSRTGSGRSSSGCSSGGRRNGRIHPAGMNARRERLGHFRIDVALPDHTAERHLHVTAGAAEAIIEIEMPESGVEVGAPEEIHDAAAEPDAFGVAGGAGQRLGGFLELVDLLLAFLRLVLRGLLFLSRFRIAALRRGRESKGQQQGGTEGEAQKTRQKT